MIYGARLNPWLAGDQDGNAAIYFLVHATGYVFFIQGEYYAGKLKLLSRKREVFVIFRLLDLFQCIALI